MPQAQKNSKGKAPAGGQGRHRTQTKHKYLINKYASTSEVTGPGVFVTCIRGKENASFQEIVEALGGVADDLYPNINAQPGPSDTAPTAPEEFPAPPIESIELQLQRELQTLGAGDGETLILPTSRGAKRRLDEADGGESEAENSDGTDSADPQPDQAKANVKPKGKRGKKRKIGLEGIDDRFSHGDLETDCSFFVACKAGVNPVDLVGKYLSHVIKTGISRTRYTQRLVPVDHICKSELPTLIELVRKVVEGRFEGIAVELGKSKDGAKPLTYRIEFRERKTSRLTKVDVLNAAGAMAPGWKVALEGPDVVLAIEAYKMNVGVGVLLNYEELKRYNVEAITKSYIQKAAAMKDDKPVPSNVESTGHQPVKLWQGNQPEEGAYDFAQEIELEVGEVRQSVE